MATIAYLIGRQGQQDTEDQKNMIHSYAQKKDLRIDNYITVEVPSAKNERSERLKGIFANVDRWDVVVLSDLIELGQSLAEIVGMMKVFSERGVRFIAARQDIDLNRQGDPSSKAATAVFDVLAELEKGFASERIRTGLDRKRREGAKLGRPKGSMSSSKLDTSRELIVDYLEKGVSKTSLARILGTSPSNLMSYLRTRKISVVKRAKGEVTRPIVPETPAPADQTRTGALDEATVQRVTINRLDETQDVILCRHCGKNIMDPRTTTCTGGYIDYQDGESYRRIPYPENEEGRCPKCSVHPGGFHHDGCYIERCPRCGERLVSCACGRLQ